MGKAMKALVYHGPGVLEVEERAIPMPKADEVQIKIKKVSICGSDLGAYRFASDRFAPPLVLGHEFSGDITMVGDEVKDLKAGQKVTVNPMVLCNDCFFCKRGEGNLCGNRKSMGTAIGGTQTDGAMREYVTVPAWMVVPVADNVSYEAAAMLEPCGVTLACAKTGRTVDEQSVVLIGSGPIGLLIVKFLKALGVPKVIVSDILDTRLAKAKECGADEVINAKDEDVAARVKELTDSYGADRVIIAAGVGSSINQSFELVRNGGTIVLVALMHEKVEIDPMEIVGRGLKFLGSYMFTSEMKEAAQMLAEGRLNVEDLITSTYLLERGQEAFDILNNPQNTEIKVQIEV
ncbi:galactitol-1-phosphate 5-dehydrogenase [Faecalicatena orotica]|uniref:L-iditol 2-dehydrogenase n=1 Tax=Faecalicatena orotica TaxID=1544 RepID=A0A2Y9B8G0_9FIRM|nr:galactitol-1-phosphate 5-dehydrogenase [Faecalicatena orotica]PWJ31957.1 L-iditol 2-dehydrogenase [Faecalicatena orotica]SSA53785.1 L-iditol 2-dehydrogenase [Faecalicatena orotica]